MPVKKQKGVESLILAGSGYLSFDSQIGQKILYIL
jgi:hypothetical protein